MKNLDTTISPDIESLDIHAIILTKNPYIVFFLPGFMSDIEGKNQILFVHLLIKTKLGFLAIEYSGHGKSQENLLKET